MSVRPVAFYLMDFGSKERHLPGQLDEAAASSFSFEDAPQEDMSLLLEEAAARGREEGKEAVRADYEQQLAEEKSQFEKTLAQERNRWVDDEGAKIEAVVTAAFERLEIEIAACNERILQPFLEMVLRRQVIDALVENLSIMMSSEQHSLIRISGPGDLLSALQAKLPAFSGAIEFMPDESCDVTVIADQTIIESQMQAWIDRISGELE
jgi:hypothetical protein